MAKLLTEWDIHQLKAAPVISCDGLILGRLDGIVHHSDGRMSALVVRRRWFHTFSSMVLLEGAQLHDGAIHLDPLAAYLPPAEAAPRRTTVAT
jgi:hypothetical protein